MVSVDTFCLRIALVTDVVPLRLFNYHQRWLTKTFRFVSVWWEYACETQDKPDDGWRMTDDGLTILSSLRSETDQLWSAFRLGREEPGPEQVNTNIRSQMVEHRSVCGKFVWKLIWSDFRWIESLRWRKPDIDSKSGSFFFLLLLCRWGEQQSPEFAENRTGDLPLCLWKTSSYPLKSIHLYYLA